MLWLLGFRPTLAVGPQTLIFRQREIHDVLTSLCARYKSLRCRQQYCQVDSSPTHYWTWLHLISILKDHGSESELETDLRVTVSLGFWVTHGHWVSDIGRVRSGHRSRYQTRHWTRFQSYSTRSRFKIQIGSGWHLDPERPSASCWPVVHSSLLLTKSLSFLPVPSYNFRVYPVPTVHSVNTSILHTTVWWIIV